MALLRRTSQLCCHVSIYWSINCQSASEFYAGYSKQLAGFVIGPDSDLAACEPNWATPNTVALELTTVRLRDFSPDRRHPPILVCTPYALRLSHCFGSLSVAATSPVKPSDPVAQNCPKRQ